MKKNALSIQEVDSQQSRFNKGMIDWRDITDLWLKQASELEMFEVRTILQDVKLHKQSLITQYGESAGSKTGPSWRQALKLPNGLLYFYELFEPEIWKNSPKGYKQRIALRKAVPEFLIAEKI